MIKKLLCRIAMLCLALLSMYFIEVSINQLVLPGSLDQALNMIYTYLFIGGVALICIRFLGDLILTLRRC